MIHYLKGEVTMTFDGGVVIEFESDDVFFIIHVFGRIFFDLVSHDNTPLL